MGLVSTWLNGIGLRSVVPTFEAAGIVSPSHLANLDVSYFESLGVTDPDDRRKLFYLVQRIKLAVNNKKDSNSISSPNAEERVDAVLSENFDFENVENTKNNNRISNDTDGSPREEKKIELGSVRKSKRIRAKKKKHTDVASMGKHITEADTSISAKSKVRRNTNPVSTTSEIVPTSSPKTRPAKKSSSKVVKERVDKSVSTTRNLSSKSSIPSASSTIASSDSELDSMPNRQQPESKLPVSTRGIHKVPIVSQMGEVGSSSFVPENQIDEDAVRADGSVTSSLKSRRRVTLATNVHQTSHSFGISGDKISNKTNFHSDNETGLDNLPNRTKSRPSKSMSVSESVLLQQYQRNKQKRSSMLPSRNDVNPSPTATAIPVLSSKFDRMTTTTTSGKSLLPTPSLPVITQVTGGATDSWETKIGYLREDNNAEHELFREEVEDESQYHEYYDMRIKVIVRKRPLSKSESRTGGIDIIHPLDYGNYGKTLVYQPKTRVDLTKEVETVPFAFDNVFDETSTNIGIYNRSLRNLVEPFFKGQWATVFAYGQTGSGKTYTMMGSSITGVNAGTATMDESNLGLYYLAAIDIFEMLKMPEYSHLNVHVSLFEIYGGKLFDLLNDRKQIKCLEDSKGKVCFPGLTEHAVQAPNHVMDLIEQGSENRSTGTTSRNADSSRSHAVLQIKLIKRDRRRKNIEHGRFSFIDLAGSERGADTSNASKATRLEGAEINTSLLALKEVIRALATGGSMTHIPFRGSKLTQVLKDSFVGENSRCCMVACISPDIGNCEQTLNTLRYADRVKERNSETGVIPASCQQSTKLSSSQTLGKLASSRSKHHETTKELHHAEKTIENDRNYLDDISVGENDLSESFLSQSATDRLPHGSKFSGKQKAGQTLVSNHRSVMSRWLSMVKTEMSLVNQVDADRDGLDQYILQLENVQKAQIGFLSELRDSLQHYVTAAEGPHQVVDDDDDSFEDLRD